MKVKTEKIGPRKAQEYLAKNSRNRPLRERHAQRLHEVMHHNRYVENGDPIRFDTEGNLIDGQHRLTAIVMSGKTYQFIVVRELPSDAYETIDRQSKRSLSDTMKNHDVYAYALTAATTKKILQYGLCAGTKDFTARNRQATLGTTDWNYLEFLKNCPEVLDSAKLIGPHSKMLAGKIPLAIVTACHYLFTRAGHANDYWVKFAAQDGIRAGTGLHRLNKLLHDNSLSRARLPIDTIFWLAIHAGMKDLNTNGKKVTALVLPATVPSIRGLNADEIVDDFGIDDYNREKVS